VFVFGRHRGARGGGEMGRGPCFRVSEFSKPNAGVAAWATAWSEQPGDGLLPTLKEPVAASYLCVPLAAQGDTGGVAVPV